MEPASSESAPRPGLPRSVTILLTLAGAPSWLSDWRLPGIVTPVFFRISSSPCVCIPFVAGCRHEVFPGA